MPCRCLERRQAITIAAKAIADGDAAELVKQTAFVVKSTAQDGNAALRQAMQATRARLSRGRRP